MPTAGPTSRAEVAGEAAQRLGDVGELHGAVAEHDAGRSRLELAERRQGVGDDAVGGGAWRIAVAASSGDIPGASALRCSPASDGIALSTLASSSRSVAEISSWRSRYSDAHRPQVAGEPARGR